MLLALASGCSTRPRETGPVEIAFWHAWGGYEGRYLDSLVEEFNDAHPGIRVEPSFFNVGDKLLAAIAGGKPPDVATVWDFMLVTMGESGCFLPLEERLEEAGYTPDSYLPHIWEYGMFSRHKWGVPTTLNVMAMLCNNALVRQAGLDPDHPPQTIQELTDWAQRLTVQDENGQLQCIGFVPIAPIYWMWNFGGRLYNPAGRRFTLDQPENVEAVRWMAALYQRVGIDNWRRFSAGFGRLDSPQNPFYVGKIAMREDGQWQVQFIQQFAPELDYGVFPLPSAVEGQAGVTLVTGSFWVIPVGTEHPEEAWEFLRWLIAPEQSARFCTRLRNIPPLRESLDRPEFQEVLQDDKFAFFVNLIRSGRTRPMPATPVGQQLNERLTQGLELVYSGKEEPEAFLTRLNEQMNDELERALDFLGIEEEPSPGGKNRGSD